MKQASYSTTMERKHRSKINSLARGRWRTYAAAATASTFAAANSAEATIHYSGLLNQKIGRRDRAIFHLDPTGGGFVVSHFQFAYGSSSISNGGVAQLYVYGAKSAAVNAVSGACHAGGACVSNLDQRDVISQRPVVPAGGTLAWEYDGSQKELYGQFLKRGYGVVGFKFNNGAGDQYGWVRLAMVGFRSRPRGPLIANTGGL